MMSREWRSLPQAVREELRAHQGSAPVKLGPIAKILGLKLTASTLPAGISGEIRPDADSESGFNVRVNRHDSGKRQRFTVAHEIGHFLLHRDQIGTGISDDVLYRSTLSDRREAEANRIAADLLMPEHLIAEGLAKARELEVEDEVLYLAEAFDVSEAAMKIRLEML